MKPQPFTDDLEYIDAEFAFLRVRAARAQAENHLRDALHLQDVGADGGHGPTVKELQTRLIIVRDREKQLREEIDSRLEAHRADISRPLLGIDRLAEQHRLNADERLILLASAVPAISQHLSEEVLADFGSIYGSATVEDLIRVLLPVTAWDWIEGRRILDEKSPLVASGMLVVMCDRSDSPADDWATSPTYISPSALQTLTGQLENSMAPASSTVH